MYCIAGGIAMGGAGQSRRTGSDEGWQTGLLLMEFVCYVAGLIHDGLFDRYIIPWSIPGLRTEPWKRAIRLPVAEYGHLPLHITLGAFL
jgi:hypothetical protein